MKLRMLATSALLGLSQAACSAHSPEGPLRSTPFPEATTTLIWHGTGQARRRDSGTWVRVPEHDYELTVVQRRYDDRWESTKEMHRRHPDYDGSAGPRDQSHHFTVVFDTPASGGVFSIESTMGPGDGSIDAALASATMRLHAAGVSSLAPFDTYTIEQRYQYDLGKLTETVTLLDSSANQQDQAWVILEEEATLFSPPTNAAVDG